MLLKSMTITNFKNIKNSTLDFGGASCYIKGENFTGKTNSLNAIAWCLTGHGVDGKPIDVAPFDNPMATTEVTLTFVGASTFAIKRQQVAKVDTLEGLKGYTAKCFIDDKAIKTTAFPSTLAECFGTQHTIYGLSWVEMFTNPHYLGNMGEGSSWKKLRTFLENCFGRPTKITKKDSDKLIRDLDLIDLDGTSAKVKADLALAKSSADEAVDVSNILTQSHDRVCPLCGSKITLTQAKAVHDKATSANKDYAKALSIATALEDYRQRYYLAEEIMLREKAGIRVCLGSCNLNGSLEECCSLENDNGTPWKYLSKSEKVIVGAKLIASIGTSQTIPPMLPILVDEGGEITDTAMKKLLANNAQWIVVRAETNGGLPHVELMK